MRVSVLPLTSVLLILSPLINAEADPVPKPEPVPAALGTVLGPAGPQSAKRQETICGDPNYPINCANGYCCPYNTLCDGSQCDTVTTKSDQGSGAFANIVARQELAIVLGVIGGAFAVL